MISILFAYSVFAQDIQSSDKPYQDSLSNSDFHKIKLKLNHELDDNLFYFDKLQYDKYMKFAYDWKTSIYNQPEYDEAGSGVISLLKPKKELLSALRKMPGFQNKTDLGVFGQILGYVNAAAAVSLMVVHLNKYYWNEEKKPPKSKKK